MDCGQIVFSVKMAVLKLHIDIDNMPILCIDHWIEYFTIIKIMFHYVLPQKINTLPPIDAICINKDTFNSVKTRAFSVTYTFPGCNYHG